MNDECKCEHRLVRVLVSPAKLVCTRPGDYCFSNDIPQGAWVRNVSYDAGLNQWCLLLEHDSFAGVPEGAIVPVITGPIMRRASPPLTVDVRGMVGRTDEGGGGGHAG